MIAATWCVPQKNLAGLFDCESLVESNDDDDDGDPGCCFLLRFCCRHVMKAIRTSGKLNPNMGRLPILEVNGVCIGQSKAIERYFLWQPVLCAPNDKWGGAVPQIAMRHTFFQHL